MSERSSRELVEIARVYEVHAAQFPDGSLGRIANLAEAAKYHDLAARAASWPEPREEEGR